ncbi:MAG: thioredoxin family protein [Bacteroidetes bacterium]|nr:thioredoxin family protein [Bacteroidota bacterium]
MQKIILTLTLLLGLTMSYAQQPKPYNENQDARADIKKAIAQAQKENKNVMMQFGGNWCPWCMRFHALVTSYPKLDSLMKANYVYVLINVPSAKDKAKRDYTLFAEYQYPNRFGFPVFVILDSKGQRLNTVDSDGFEYPNPKVPGYDTLKVERFLKMWSVKALDAKSYNVQK